MLPLSMTAETASSLLASEEPGLRLNSRDAPLVSVIIRSMDRPTLSDALDSVASQTYPNIEVVVVNAKDASHREMSELCGRFPLRIVGSGERLHRSRAANRGLDDARGEYLIFLDDDDWFDTNHIEKLVQTIQTHTDVKVVYSGVRCVDEDKHPLPTKFATPFDATQLVAGNYIPIHAALFSRTLLELGCRVDESLDLYEDWDFWIQASMFTDFLFIGGLSAVYRITQQSGFALNANNIVAEKASLIVYKKWLSRLQDNQLIKLMHAARLNRAIDQPIVNIGETITERDGRIASLNQTITERDGEIAALLSSTSWRITIPLRFAGRQLRRRRHLLHILPDMVRRMGGIKS